MLNGFVEGVFLTGLVTGAHEVVDRRLAVRRLGKKDFLELTAS